MAYIRISYKYKSFPFSEEATKYSKQLGYIQNRFYRFCVVIMMFAVAIFLYCLICSMVPSALQLILFIIMGVGSIIASIALLRYLERVNMARRDTALRRDLIKLAGADGEKIFQEIKRKEEEEKSIRK